MPVITLDAFGLYDILVVIQLKQIALRWHLTLSGLECRITIVCVEQPKVNLI